MATNPATNDDLTARSLRTLSTQELSVGTALLGDAWNILRQRVPSLSSRLDDATTGDLEDLVVQVECAMVLRVLNNPDGVLEEQGDDYSRRLDQAVSTGMLYVADAEAELLARTDQASGTGFTIKPAGTRKPAGYWDKPDHWTVTAV